MKMGHKDSMTQREHFLVRRYGELLHAVQSGVKFDHESGGQDGSPKHLRTGINSALVDSGALAQLLQKKGIFTQEEYLEQLVESAEGEVKRYETLLAAKFGKPVTLQ